MGVEVSDRAVQGAGVLPKLYYTLGLFVLGGMDLGVPRAGPPLGQALLWFAYFAAPAITASAVIEGILKILKPEAWLLRRTRGHVVIAGCGKLTLLYLAKLRRVHPHRPVVIVDVRSHPSLEEAREAYGAQIVYGDITSDALLGTLRLPRAERVLLLTGDDFSNLDAATKILSIAPDLGPRMVVHVSDLGFMRAMSGTRVARECVPFNTHQIAAAHVVQSLLLAHFQKTKELDTIVLAGFGRFCQTVLDELQRRAPRSFDQVVIVDLTARLFAQAFEEEVGFAEHYQTQVIDGDLKDLAVWKQVEGLIGPSHTRPVFILGSGDDGTNLRVALRLRAKYPDALVVARSFQRSSFGAEVANERGFYVLGVADLIGECMPLDWFGGDEAGAPLSKTLSPLTAPPAHARAEKGTT